MLLEATHLTFTYNGDLQCASVRDVSLRVESGKLVALIGANGSGKSSLIKLFAGINQPTAGEIFLDGESYASMNPNTRARRIGYVPQNSTLVFPFTALEVVLTGRAPYARRFRIESETDRRTALECLRAVEAVHLAHRPVTELSGGERELVQLARALAQNPSLLLLDEPAAALDLKHRAALVKHLARLRDEQGIAALVVTHDLNLIEPAFDEVLAMRDGAILARGTASEVLRESVLTNVFDDEHIRAERAFNRTFVWSN